MSTSTVRLNKYIALHLGVSRREADQLIESKKVTVNGSVVTLGKQVTDQDHIVVNGTPLIAKTDFVYIALHKPTGYICSRRQQGDTPTIYSLLPKDFQALKPVGRLDKDSSGLLLLTNDGDFAHRMTHPSFHKNKSYQVTISKDLEPLHQQMISEFGLVLDDGPSKLHLTRQYDTSRKHWLVSMHEGRNRQIRRTFGALGYAVTALHRTSFGAFSLHQLAVGKWQAFTPGA